jgi:glycosyltransferase involved in cell wall biosynthesis
LRRIFFLAYHFPPIGGAGVQRSARFCRLLPEFGYEPVCVTGPGTARSRWAPADESLLTEIPPETEVHRLPGPEPQPLGGWRVPMQRWLRLREPWSSWWVEGVKTLGKDLVGTTDLIYSWMQPYDSAEAAAWLSRSSGKPWVADLGDPWALDEMMVYPTTLHRRRELARMRSLLTTASAIVMSTPEAVRSIRERFPELATMPVVAIPNGFDPRDFEGPPPRREDGAFLIVHTGYLHTELGRMQRRQTRSVRRFLGGAVEGVDILTRSHLYLLEAIDRAVADDPSLGSTIKLDLAGVLSASDREIGRAPCVVQMRGYLPHAETVPLMRSADLLFLPMQNLPPGIRSSIVPGKTYEYLASGRPIVAAVPDGDARDILAAAGSGLICRPDDVAGMKRIIERQVARFRARERGPAPDPEVVARFAYPRLARELGSVFDSVVSGDRGDRATALAERAA